MTVIRARCSQTIHILDRFHIIATTNAALDQVRAGEAVGWPVTATSPC